MTTEQRTSNGTAQIKVAEAKAGLYARMGAGLFFMLCGAATFAYGVKIDNHALMIGGASGSILGAMMLPSVFDAIKPVITYVFPNGIPLIGGRRVNDPPEPPKSGVSQGNPS